MTDLLVVDFETFYDRDYSLSKMTTEEYIRDRRFETIGVAVSVNGERAVWRSGTQPVLRQFLAEYDWANSVAVAHNAVFDMSILSYVYGFKPKLICDTLSMAKAVNGATVGGSLSAQVEHYGLGEKGDEVVKALGKHRHDFTPTQMASYAAYCRNDVMLTYKLFEVLAQGFPASEIKLIDMTMRMATEPVLQLDSALLEQHFDDVVTKKKALLAKVARFGGTASGKDEIMSNARLAGLLSSLGVSPPTKISKTTNKETYAFAKTDEEFTELLEHPNPEVQAIVGARLGVKSTLEETRTKRLIGVATRGPLPVQLNYYGGHTGRWSGAGSMNLQNLPRGSAIRSAIKAPKGYVLVDGDLSQIEARILAWLAGQWDLVEGFANGVDVYKGMGSTVYGTPEDLIDKMQRFVGKTTILSCGYGVGPDRFQAALKNATPSVTMPRDECQRIINVYRRKYGQIPELWDNATQVLGAMVGDRTMPFGLHEALTVCGKEGIRLPNGFFLRYPNLRWVELEEGGRPQFVYDRKRGRGVSACKTYGGALTENVCQALARLVIGDHMLAIQKRYKVAMTVHDSVCALVPEQEEAEGVAFVKECMAVRPSWAPDLPLACEVGSGASYGDC